MEIKETRQTAVNENTFQAFSQMTFANRMFNFQFSDEYYANHKQEIENKILSFIQYTILGYTDIEPEEDIEENFDEARTISENDKQNIMEKYGEITPESIDKYIEGKANSKENNMAGE